MNTIVNNLKFSMNQYNLYVQLITRFNSKLMKKKIKKILSNN